MFSKHPNNNNASYYQNSNNNKGLDDNLMTFLADVASPLPKFHGR